MSIVVGVLLFGEKGKFLMGFSGVPISIFEEFISEMLSIEFSEGKLWGAIWLLIEMPKLIIFQLNWCLSQF